MSTLARTADGRPKTRRNGPARQALVLAGATGLSQLLLAGMFASAARLSNPTDFGTLGTGFAIAVIGAALLDFGTNALWTRDLIASRTTVAGLRPRLFGKAVIALSAGAVIALVISIALPGSELVAAGPLLTCTLLAQAAQVPLRARLRSDLVGVISVLDRLVALAVFGGALLLPGIGVLTGLWVSICCGLLSEVLVVLGREPQLKAMVRPAWPYRGARHYGLSTLATSAQSMDIVLISTIAGPAQAGLFAAVNRWTAPMGLLVTAFSSATTPFVAQAGTLRAALVRVRTALWMPCAAVLCCILVAVSAPWTVAFLLGPAYAGSTPVLQVLALAVIPAIAAQPLSAYLQALGYDRTVAVLLAGIVAAQLIAVVGALIFGDVVTVAVMIAAGQLAMVVALAIVAARVWSREASTAAP